MFSISLHNVETLVHVMCACMCAHVCMLGVLAAIVYVRAQIDVIRLFRFLFTQVYYIASPTRHCLLESSSGRGDKKRNSGNTNNDSYKSSNSDGNSNNLTQAFPLLANPSPILDFRYVWQHP